MKKSLWTKDIVLTALAAALLSAGKQALAAIPNVEVVTLLIMLYAACFKPQIAFIVTGIFIVIECFIWGIHTWVLAYVIHWNFISFATFLLVRVFKIKNRFIFFAFTILVTACFGVLTSLIDAIVGAGGSMEKFAMLFVTIYVRGIFFYVVQVVGNAVFNIVLFVPMRNLLDRLMIKYYGRDIFLREEDGGEKVKKENAIRDAEDPSVKLTEEGNGDSIDKRADDSTTGSDANNNVR